MSHNNLSPDRPNQTGFDITSILPINPQEVAEKYPSDEIRNRLVFAERACAEGLRQQLAKLKEDQAVLEEQIHDREARRAAYEEAYHIAISMERGE